MRRPGGRAALDSELSAGPSGQATSRQDLWVPGERSGSLQPLLWPRPAPSGHLNPRGGSLKWGFP